MAALALPVDESRPLQRNEVVRDRAWREQHDRRQLTGRGGPIETAKELSPGFADEGLERRDLHPSDTTRVEPVSTGNGISERDDLILVHRDQSGTGTDEHRLQHESICDDRWRIARANEPPVVLDMAPGGETIHEMRERSSSKRGADPLDLTLEKRRR